MIGRFVLFILLLLKLSGNRSCQDCEGNCIEENSKFYDQPSYNIETSVEHRPFLQRKCEPHEVRNLLGDFFGNYWCDFSSISWEKQDGNSLYVLGDADGSFSRLVLSALAAGYINLDHSVIEELKILLKRESSTSLRDLNSLKSFQKSEKNYNSCKKIFDAITYNKNPSSKLVFLGDIVADRLTCNLNATMSIVEKLHQMGAIFIKGNHEDEKLLDEQLFMETQGGEFRYSKKSEDKNKFANIIKKCFKFAHYDSDFNILFTHAFISQNSDTSKLNYCGKIIKNDSPEKVCEEINNLDSSEVLSEMTNFRTGLKKSDGTVQMLYSHNPKNYIHLHGHDEDFALKDAVYKLESIKNGKYSLNSRNQGSMQPKICQIIKK